MCRFALGAASAPFVWLDFLRRRHRQRQVAASETRLAERAKRGVRRRRSSSRTGTLVGALVGHRARLHTVERSASDFGRGTTGRSGSRVLPNQRAASAAVSYLCTEYVFHSVFGPVQRRIRNTSGNCKSSRTALTPASTVRTYDNAPYTRRELSLAPNVPERPGGAADARKTLWHVPTG
jgi:hypothetical protein